MRDKVANIIDGFFGVDSAYFGVDKYELADYLLANNMIALPCEIGADIWYLSGDVKNGWETLKPTHAEKVSGGFNLKMLNSITGKLEPWYYLSKEDAEVALKKM